jgi:hypothetical protein
VLLVSVALRRGGVYRVNLRSVYPARREQDPQADGASRSNGADAGSGGRPVHAPHSAIFDVGGVACAFTPEPAGIR